jgi:two-component system sensor histidine kinase AdeS
MDLKRANLRLASAIDLAVASIDPGEGRIDRQVDGDLVANVDAQRLQQVLMNLVTNSVRYGGGRTLLRAVADGDDLVIEVHDDGEGVPPKYQVVIWDRFERGVHRYDARKPGSGIGLAVVSAVARAHGGTADYRGSERLGGACFSVRIPAAVVAEPAEDQPIGEVVVFGV